MALSVVAHNNRIARESPSFRLLAVAAAAVREWTKSEEEDEDQNMYIVNERMDTSMVRRLEKGMNACVHSNMKHWCKVEACKTEVSSSIILKIRRNTLSLDPEPGSQDDSQGMHA